MRRRGARMHEGDGGYGTCRRSARPAARRAGAWRDPAGPCPAARSPLARFAVAFAGVLAVEIWLSLCERNGIALLSADSAVLLALAAVAAALPAGLGAYGIGAVL